jgi:transposase
MVRHLETRSPEEAKTSRAYYSRLTGIDYDAAERAALRLYVEGWTCQEIARRFGCSAQSVCGWVDKAEIKKRTLSEARRLAAKRRKEAAA